MRFVEFYAPMNLVSRIFVQLQVSATCTAAGLVQHALEQYRKEHAEDKDVIWDPGALSPALSLPIAFAGCRAVQDLRDRRGWNNRH